MRTRKSFGRINKKHMSYKVINDINKSDTSFFNNPLFCSSWTGNSIITVDIYNHNNTNIQRNKKTIDIVDESWQNKKRKKLYWSQSRGPFFDVISSLLSRVFDSFSFSYLYCKKKSLINIFFILQISKIILPLKNKQNNFSNTR